MSIFVFVFIYLVELSLQTSEDTVHLSGKQYFNLPQEGQLLGWAWGEGCRARDGEGCGHSQKAKPRRWERDAALQAGAPRPGHLPQ